MSETGADPLGGELIIQRSSSTRAVVVGLRNAIDSAPRESILLLGPSGSGKTLLLRAVRELLGEGGVFFAGPKANWNKPLNQLLETQNRWILVDSFDRFEKKAQRGILERAKKQGHFLIASSQEGADGERLLKLWRDVLPQPQRLNLSDLQARVDDVTEYLRRWLKINSIRIPDNVGFNHIAGHLTNLYLSEGFRSLDTLLVEAAKLNPCLWDPPDYSALSRAYSAFVEHSEKTRSQTPVLYVEGHTDREYLLWAADYLENGVADFEIVPCGAASKILQNVVKSRNEGRKNLALLDGDSAGLKAYKDLKGYQHPALCLSKKYDPLHGKAEQYLKHSIEIEDLLPVADIERFMGEKGRQPELVIELPLAGLKKIVVQDDDKSDLADWARANLSCESCHQFIELYKMIRSKLQLT